MLTAHKSVARHLFFLVDVTRFFDNNPLTTWRTNPRLQQTVDWLTEKLDLKGKLAEFGGKPPKEGSTWNDVELVDPIGKYVASLSCFKIVSIDGIVHSVRLVKIFSSNTRPMLIEMTAQNSDGSGYLYEGYEKAEGYNSGDSSDENETPDFLAEEGGEPSEYDFIKTYPPPDTEFGNLNNSERPNDYNSYLFSTPDSDNTQSSGPFNNNIETTETNNNVTNNNETASKSLMIFKRGDDLRQDYVVQTMFFIFNRIWALSPMRYKPFIHQYK